MTLDNNSSTMLGQNKIGSWENEAKTHAIHKSPNGDYCYYQDGVCMDCGSLEYLTLTYGFALVGKTNKGTTVGQVNNITL